MNSIESVCENIREIVQSNEQERRAYKKTLIDKVMEKIGDSIAMLGPYHTVSIDMRNGLTEYVNVFIIPDSNTIMFYAWNGDEEEYEKRGKFVNADNWEYIGARNIY